MSGPPEAALRGMLCAAAAMAMFALSDAIGKYLTRWYPVPLIVGLRFVSACALWSSVLAASGGLRFTRTARFPLQLLRGAIYGVAALLFLSALRVMQLADAYAVVMTGPVWVALFAVPILGERLERRTLIAVLAGFCGVLLVLRPGVGLFSAEALLPLLVAAAVGVYQVLTRKLSGFDAPQTTLFYSLLVGAVVYLPVLFVWWKVPEDWSHVLFIGLMGALMVCSNLALIWAYVHASAGVVGPINYMQLLWAILFGWLVFGDLPDHWTLLGAAIIIGAGLYVVRGPRA